MNREQWAVGSEQWAGSRRPKAARRRQRPLSVVGRSAICNLQSAISIMLSAALLLGPAGCAHQQTRMKSADENDKDKLAEVKTIRDVASFSNINPIVVSGVGLVTGLEGTGGDPPPGGYRTLLEDELRKKKVE